MANKLFDESELYSKDFRAKQFLPFNALKGYNDIIKEKEITKEDRKKLSEDELDILEQKFINVKKGKMVRVRYYKGFGYTNLIGMVSNIDIIYRNITIVKTKIQFDDIIDVEVSIDEF